MRLKPSDGYVVADQTNLPCVDQDMLNIYFATHTMLMRAEIRAVKAARGGRKSYIENAIGYVAVRRSSNTVEVTAKVTPEHRVRSSPYAVSAVIDEKEKKIAVAKCHGCLAQAGMCKHATALLF